MEINVYLAGRVALEADGEVVLDERHLRRRQERLVFAYLVSERRRPVSREELAQVVWGEGEMPPAWEVALSALVSRPRSVLASKGLDAYGVSIPHEHGRYQLRLPPQTWVDLETAASAVDDAEAALRLGNLERVLGPAFVATTITRRPFLAGDDGEWTEAQRRKIERLLLRALDCLTKLWLATGEATLAVEGATEAIARDPYREASHQLLMRAHAASGDRAAAVRAYNRLRSLLAEEVGAAPSAETEEVYQSLLR